MNCFGTIIIFIILADSYIDTNSTISTKSNCITSTMNTTLCRTLNKMITRTMDETTVQTKTINTNSLVNKTTKRKKRAKSLRLATESYKSCRRQNGRRKGRMSTQLNLNDMPSAEGGPTRNTVYDPNYGYEPYWIDGGWVMVPIVTRGLISNDPHNNCGLKCTLMNKIFGPVCGRNRHFQYKSFVNICALKSEDCFGFQRWMAIYRGPCVNVTIINRNYILSSVDNIIRDFIHQYTFTESFIGFPDETIPPQ